MIKITYDKDEIIPLWQEAFGDTENEINFFIDNCRHAKCLAYYINNEIASMLYLVNCKLDGNNALYIYAACTAEKYRGQGIMTKLIEYCIKQYSKQYLICLIPASDTLVDYYSERKICNKADIASLVFNESEEICEYLFEGYKLTDPKALYYKEEK